MHLLFKNGSNFTFIQTIFTPEGNSNPSKQKMSEFKNNENHRFKLECWWRFYNQIKFKDTSLKCR